MTLNNWPNPEHPGVPFQPDKNGAHQLDNNSTSLSQHGRGPWTMLWHAVDRRWTDIYGNHVLPDSVAHLVYIGPCVPLQKQLEDFSCLQDPNLVHVNLLSGKIAKPSVDQILHVYPEIRQQIQEEIELRKDTEATLAAWFDLAARAESAGTDAIKTAIARYLSAARSGGMSSRDSDLVTNVVDESARLYLWRELVPVLRTMLEKEVRQAALDMRSRAQESARQHYEIINRGSFSTGNLPPIFEAQGVMAAFIAHEIGRLSLPGDKEDDS